MNRDLSAAALCSDLLDSVHTVIQGADAALRLIVTALFCGGHVLLEDLPGTGKTTLAKSLAVVTGFFFSRIQCTPDLMPADLTGFETLVTGETGTYQTVFRKGPVFTNLLLADEINRMAPRTQSGLLECMAEQQVTYNGNRYALPDPFFVIATQNPIELQGTFPLPEAQLDRFFMRIRMGHPSRAAETEILRSRRTADPIDSLRQITSPKQILQIRAAVRRVKVSDSVLSYLLDLSDATRSHPQVRYGLSTRAALALQSAAQCYAAISGRDYVTPDDVKAVFPAVCAHRIRLSGSMLGDSIAADRFAADLLSSVEVPKS
ncbi:MAG: MoxR family ATPase [Oscillospiraceae bacterium]|nr:MoxR family ATPase [Oscillospiraceae bacterium]